MSIPLLTTKLYIPKARPNLVPRSRLIERLNESLPRKLTLISAPAGFGKTTLLSEWIPKSPHCVTWLSLDNGDNDPSRFWRYFIASLQELRPDLGNRALELLQSPQAPPITSIVITLINEIATFPDTFAMVLDDYHLIDSKAVDEALTYLLKHQPHQMHLVIATREDPNLGLSRLRAHDQMTELRAADLRFTSEETAIFLNQLMGLGLSAAEVNSLEARIEGWIAGLQLAALSMQGREDVHGFIESFTGDNRYIVEYLVEEVLERQPEQIRSFLLQTSILDRLSGPLCDAVRFGKSGKPRASGGPATNGQEQSNVLLDALERGNLFLVSLDDKGQWFRYHHLFADVLRAHLIEEQPGQIPALHRRASEWYERHGFMAEAICHALSGRDFERAAGLVELAWPEMDQNRQSATWLGWAKQLPDEFVRARPVLSAGYAWALLDRGQLEAGEARLRDAERWLEEAADESKRPAAPAIEMVVVDVGEFRALPASIAAARAYHALALGDVPSTLKHARQALDLIPEGDHLRRATAAALLALASWTCGDLEAADRSLSSAMTSYQNAGNLLFAITGAFVLADIRVTLGRLRQAFDTCQQALQLAAGQDQSVLWGTADLHTGLGELFREQDDLDAANEHLLRSKELGERGALPRWRFRWEIARARVKESQGDLDSALNLLANAERHYVRGPVPDVRSIPALQARVWVRQGRISEALGWVREQGLAPDDDLTYLREFEHLTLARVLIAQFQRAQADQPILEALRLLERLLQAAEAGGRLGSVIEILVLQALAYEAQGAMPPARESLERALRLAEPQGYARIFVDEGLPMARLLSAIAARGLMPDYTGKLLAIWNADQQKRADQSPTPSLQPPSEPAVPPANGLPVEPLSQRELEVLRLVAQGLSNREIGNRLFLALPTVKGYNRTIFRKLQARRRTEAAARARELGLL